MEFWPHALQGMDAAQAPCRIRRALQIQVLDEFNPKVGKGLQPAEPANLLAEHPVDGYDSQTDLMVLLRRASRRRNQPRSPACVRHASTECTRPELLSKPTFMIAPTVQSKTGLASVPVEAPPRREDLVCFRALVLDFSNGASVATLDVLQG